MDQQTMEKTVEKAVDKTMSRLTELLERVSKAADDLEVKDRVQDAVAALRRTRITQEDDSGAEKFMTGLLIGVAVGFGLALLLAPKSGEELREDLMQKGIELRDRASQITARQFGDGEGMGEKSTSSESGIA
jgi:YtxH-like protein